MAKLILTQVKVAELPSPPYSIGLLDAMKETYKTIHDVAVEVGSAVEILTMSFELTKGAYDYLYENKDKVMEGYNKWCYLSYLILKIEWMELDKYEGGFYLKIGFSK